MKYYILSLTRTNSEALVWWRPDSSGYTYILDQAGKYLYEQIVANSSYYNNKKDTIAIPCHVVEEFAVKIVPSNTNFSQLIGDK